jgi:hypothetical protein
MYKITRIVVSAATAVPMMASTAISPGAAAREPAGTRVVTVVAEPRLDNSSGLALAGNGQLMYTMQDARRSTLVYALDRQGRTAFTIALPAGSNEDWEDLGTATLADGRRIVVIADTGDAFQVRRAAKQGVRKTFRILRFDEPDPRAGGSVRPSGLVSYPVRYPDGATRNVETLLLQPGTGRVYLVVKTQDPAAAEEGASQQGAPAAAEVWELPENAAAGRINTLRRLPGVLPVPAASGGAFSAVGAAWWSATAPPPSSGGWRTATSPPRSPAVRSRSACPRSARARASPSPPTGVRC